MLLTINEACETLKIGRTKLYALIACGQIQARKIGRKTLVERSEIERWISTLPSYSSKN